MGTIRHGAGRCANGSWVLKLLTVSIIIIIIIITQTGCEAKEPPSKTDFCMDTTCTITIYDAMDEQQAEEVLSNTFKEIRKYEKLLSKTIEGSDVDRINNGAGQWIEVSEETVQIIRTANIISFQSGGAFDITIGAINDLWDFKSEEPQVPDAAAIKEELQHVDYRNITTSGHQVLLSDSSAQIDLGGIAKGWVADRAAAFMEEQGITRAVINLGGNVVVLGEKDEDTAWIIGIEQPFADRSEIIGTIEVTDATVVTSGIYERNFEADGVLYHHILNPETGYPVETDLNGVTVTAVKGQSGFCDAVSTACLLLGKDRAQTFIEAMQQQYPDIDLEAAFIEKNGNVTQTDGMQIRFEEE